MWCGNILYFYVTKFHFFVAVINMILKSRSNSNSKSIDVVPFYLRCITEVLNQYIFNKQVLKVYRSKVLCHVMWTNFSSYIVPVKKFKRVDDQNLTVLLTCSWKFYNYKCKIPLDLHSDKFIASEICVSSVYSLPWNGKNSSSSALQISIGLHLQWKGHCMIWITILDAPIFGLIFTICRGEHPDHKNLNSLMASL